MGRCVGYANSPRSGGAAVAIKPPPKPMKNRPARNMAIFEAHPCSNAPPMMMMDPRKRGCRRPNLSAAKGARGNETAPPMTCMLTRRPRMPPRGWLKSVIHPGLALTGLHRRYNKDTKGKLSNLTFLPLPNRLDPVEHAAVEATYVAREEWY